LDTVVVVGRRAERSLFNETLATYGQGDRFDRAAAVGFIPVPSLKMAGVATVDQASVQLRLGAARPHG
jgi:argininosuccinate synthase